MDRFMPMILSGKNEKNGHPIDFGDRDLWGLSAAYLRPRSRSKVTCHRAWCRKKA
jgi:hypothetical protein